MTAERETMKLSFILPIYKVEDYLTQCVDSIWSQLTEDSEIILVDDGSPDRCGIICDDYAARDPRIRVVHKENGGLSSARNAGMDIAQGDYLCFVDSDDYIEENTVPKLMDWIHRGGADICFLKTHKVYPDGTRLLLGENLEADSLRTREAALHHLATRPIYPGSAWGKLFRREFLEKNGFRFPKDRRLSEDLIYCLDAYLKAETFDSLDFPFYCYRQARPGSITRKIDARYYFDTFLFVQEAADRFRENRTSPEGKLALSVAAYEYAIRVCELVELSGADWDKAYAMLKDYRWVLSYGLTGKTKLVNASVTVLGLKNAAKLLDFYQKHRN